jgi:hypothetical protein
VGTWESQLLGIGRLTQILSDRLLSESFAADDMGLYVIFLQRHRVEVGLKLILERANATPPNTHKLVSLCAQVKAALTKARMAALWPPFDSAVSEYIRLVDQIDEGAATFRYPVDTKQQPWSRDDFVDLVEFERAGAAFQAEVLSLIESLAVLEPLPIEHQDAVTVATELRDFAHWCRRMIAVTDNTFDQMKTNFGALGGQGQMEASDPRMRGPIEVRQNAEDVAARADRIRARIEAAFSVALPPLPAARPLPKIPTMRFSIVPADLNTQMTALMEAVAEGMIDWLQPLHQAVEAIKARTADWSTPYARQLRDEVARLQSRQSRLSAGSP